MSDELDTSGFITTELGDIPPAMIEVADAPVEAEAVVAEGDEQESGADEAAEQLGDEGEPKPPKKTAAERIAEVTRARREAEREARHWKDVAEGRINADGTAKVSAPTASEQSPNPDDYEYGETDPRYIEAVIDHRVNKGLDEVTKNLAQRQADQAQERAWEAEINTARSEFDDFDEVFNAKSEDGAVAWDCSPLMADTIRAMPGGSKLAYALASDPAESKRIAALDGPLQLIEAGRLMARYSAPKASTKPQPKTATDAPEPPSSTARGAGGRFTVAADTDDFAAFEQQHASKWFGS